MGHGVSVREVPTGVKPPVEISAGLAVYTGTAPINSVDLTNVNKPKRCDNLAMFEEQFGPLSDDFEKWSLHEAAKAHFSVYGAGPIVCINVLDPENAYHVSQGTGESHQLVDGEVQIQLYAAPDAAMLGVIESSVVVKNLASVTQTLGEDYTLAFDEDGYLVVSIVDGGGLAEDDVILVDFDYLDPSGVTADDIIGGYSAGVYTGLEVVKQVYPALRLVPGFILAPKWSQTPEVAARMQVLAALLNGSFKTIALIDLSTDPGEIPTFAEAPAWKSDNGYSSEFSYSTWPNFKNGDDVYHGSTHAACIANIVDSEVDDVPYKSPSNHEAIGTAAVLDDGTEVLLDKEQANALNDQGIATFLNGFFGWRLWGNRTSAYPGTTDPKDAFLSIRRMFNWIGNTIILTTDENVDAPINRRLVDLVVGTITSFLNGLVAQGALVDGKIEFLKEENSDTDLADGKITFHVTLTPPSPAEEMEFVLEYDPTALEGLFEEA